MQDIPFLSRLLLLLPLSSSLSRPFSLADSRLSTLICRFSEFAGPKPEGRYSGVFLAEVIGLVNCFEGVPDLTSAAGWRLTLVNPPEFTGVKPPELMAVNPLVTDCGAEGWVSRTGVSLSEFTEACKADDANRAGDSPLRLEGVGMFECFMGLGAGLGVSGAPFSVSSC